MKHLLPLFVLLLPSFALAQVPVATSPNPRPLVSGPVSVYASGGDDLGQASGAATGSRPTKYPDYWADHKDPLVRELVAILHETRSGDVFVTALVLLKKRGAEEERLIPVILRNGERVGLFGDVLMHHSKGSARREIVEGLHELLVEMAKAKSTPSKVVGPSTLPVKSTFPAPPVAPSVTAPCTAPGPREPRGPEKDPFTPPVPPASEAAEPPCGKPPSDDEVLRRLPQMPRIPHVCEGSRKDVRIVKELIVDDFDPPRFYPLVGPARLRHCRWKCTVSFNETIASSFPFPFRFVCPKQEVVYLSRDHLYLPTGPVGTEEDGD